MLSIHLLAGISYIDLSQQLHFAHFFHTKRIVPFDIHSFNTVVASLYTIEAIIQFQGLFHPDFTYKRPTP